MSYRFHQQIQCIFIFQETNTFFFGKKGTRMVEHLVIHSFFLATREERSESQIQNRIDPNSITGVTIVAIAITRFPQWRFL